MVKDGTITINSTRSIGYREMGSPAGKPLLVFPGTPNSRLIPLPPETGWEKEVRLIIPERPGFGLSDYQPGRTLMDWPEDVSVIADAFGIDRFCVLGISAGGPYALACASALPHRITRAGIVCSVGPVDIPGALEEMPRIRKLGVQAARYIPWLLRPLLWLISNPRRNPEGFFKKMVSGNADVDYQFLLGPGMKDKLLRHYLEATRQGLRGFAREGIILSRPWGFDPDTISIPVHLWHGEKDHNVSITAVRYLEKHIPRCNATYYPEQGHWLFHHYWTDIIGTLIQ